MRRRLARREPGRRTLQGRRTGTGDRLPRIAVPEGAGASSSGRRSCIPAGIALWFERVSDDGTAVRQRHYLQLRDGRIERHWAYTAPPRTRRRGAQRDGGVLLDTRLVSGLGEVAEHEPMISIGWSGNLLERLVLADGRRLVAKRIVPGKNWIDRHTKDEGREGLLFTSGVLGRMPAAIDHAVVAAERDGDAWWVVMRDVSASLLADGKRLTREEHRRILWR